MQEIENKRRKQYKDIECVPIGYANGVASGYPLTDKDKENFRSQIQDLIRQSQDLVINNLK